VEHIQILVTKEMHCVDCTECDVVPGINLKQVSVFVILNEQRNWACGLISIVLLLDCKQLQTRSISDYNISV